MQLAATRTFPETIQSRSSACERMKTWGNHKLNSWTEKDVDALKIFSFLCEKYFESQYFKTNENLVRLVMASYHIRTTFTDSQSNQPKSLVPTIVKPRKEPFKWDYQEDQLATMNQSDFIKDYKQIDHQKICLQNMKTMPSSTKL